RSCCAELSATPASNGSLRTAERAPEDPGHSARARAVLSGLRRLVCGRAASHGADRCSPFALSVGEALLRVLVESIAPEPLSLGARFSSNGFRRRICANSR